MKRIEDILAAHPIFEGLDPEVTTMLAGCAKHMRFEAGEFLLQEGEPADWLHLLQHGKVALQAHGPHAVLTLQTLGQGDLVGVSWLAAPYRWTYDAKALDTTVTLALDAKCLRDKCDADRNLGYEMMQRFMPVLVERLQATRMQLLDLYDHAKQPCPMR